ncbi:MAG: GNAT family N-acetyltransferase [Candidatus Heimdallarchaeota archaeon]|nr:GNAT family N-acetyltransferase [Candidatus Heimdallarchaeota archaeon]
MKDFSLFLSQKKYILIFLSLKYSWVLYVSNFDYEIIQFDPNTVSCDIIDSYLDFSNILFRESEKDDPLPSQEIQLRNLEDLHPYHLIFRWLAILNETKKKVIGSAKLLLLNNKSPNYNETKHFANMVISVQEEYRRKGIGTKLLEIILHKLKEFGFITTIATITTTISGKNFCDKFKGKLVHYSIANKLRIKDVVWSIISLWKNQGLKLSEKEGVIIETYQSIPDKFLEEYCALYTEIINQAPRGEMGTKIIVTPESYRLEENHLRNKDIKLYNKITRENDGTISGLTEIEVYKNKPYQIGQRITGVKEKYRNRGLGKWLKADMLFFIKENFPATEYISTGNADNNAPMLSINSRMGFKQYREIWWYEFNLKELESELISDNK